MSSTTSTIATISTQEVLDLIHELANTKDDLLKEASEMAAAGSYSAAAERDGRARGIAAAGLRMVQAFTLDLRLGNINIESLRKRFTLRPM